MGKMVRSAGDKLETFHAGQRTRVRPRERIRNDFKPGTKDRPRGTGQKSLARNRFDAHTRRGVARQGTVWRGLLPDRALTESARFRGITNSARDTCFGRVYNGAAINDKSAAMRATRGKTFVRLFCNRSICCITELQNGFD